MKVKNILSVKQFHQKSLNQLFNRIGLIKKSAKPLGRQKLRNREIAFLSKNNVDLSSLAIQRAITRMGGTFMFPVDNPSELSYRELRDLITILPKYGMDAICIQQPEKKELKIFNSPIPIINLGYGGENPFEAIAILYTIYEKLKFIDGLTILFTGDILNSPTVTSLIYLLSNYSNITVLSTQLQTPHDFLKLSPKILDYCSEKNIDAKTLPVIPQRTDIEQQLLKYCSKIDAIYIQPIYQEDSFLRGKKYIGQDTLNNLKEKSLVFCNWPRENAIDPKVDSDPRIAYFKQAENKLFVAMALLKTIFSL